MELEKESLIYDKMVVQQIFFLMLQHLKKLDKVYLLILQIKDIINQLLIKIDVSLLIKKKGLLLLISFLWKRKKINKDKKIKQNKKTNINKPLSGSFAKVCTEFNMPDLTKKVPDILRVNVVIDKIITHDVSKNLFSHTQNTMD